MKELIEFIAKSLASNPDAVVVTETFEDGQVILRLEVAPYRCPNRFRKPIASLLLLPSLREFAPALPAGQCSNRVQKQTPQLLPKLPGSSTGG